MHESFREGNVPKERWPTTTSVGIVLWALLEEESHLPLKGARVDGKEIDLIKPYYNFYLLTLINQPRRFYKPEFNIPAIKRYLYYHNLTRINGKFYWETPEYKMRKSVFSSD